MLDWYREPNMDAKVTSSRSCPVCGNNDLDVTKSYRGTHEAFSGLMRARCRSCGMVFSTPMPSQKALNEYNASYFASAHGGASTNVIALAFFSGIAHLRLAHLERYISSRNIAISSLLEFGPGPGFFAVNWLERHPKTIYSACETDTSCHAALDRIGVHLVEASSLAEGTTPVDLVVMSHVLEHVPTPKEFLADATRNLRKGGALFIEVPCMDYEHKPIDEPHLLFFDKRPMQHLLGTSGFGDIEVGYYGQEIDRLRSNAALRRIWMTLRSRLIARGLVAPFAWDKSGMELLTNPLERAAVAPFKAHCESSKPAWWLRALARKK
jgi:SAM-dependent methyltransferase